MYEISIHIGVYLLHSLPQLQDNSRVLNYSHAIYLSLRKDIVLTWENVCVSI